MMKLEAHGVIFIQQCNVKSPFIMVCIGGKVEVMGMKGLCEGVTPHRARTLEENQHRAVNYKQTN